MKVDHAQELLTQLGLNPKGRLSWTDNSDRWPRFIEDGVGLWEMRVFTLAAHHSGEGFRLHWRRLETDHGMYGEGEQRLERGHALDYLTLEHMTLVRPPEGGLVSWVEASD